MDYEIEAEIKMEKVIGIEGMSCQHCVNHVVKAINALGLETTVSLEEKNAKIADVKDVSDETIAKAITDAGYTVTNIK